MLRRTAEAASKAQDLLRPSPATSRRLMKEYAATSAELGSDDDGPSSSVLSPYVSDAQQGGSSAGAERTVSRRKRKKTANPDLLVLRPWDADGEDLLEWLAVIRGPGGGMYSGGVFELSITVPPTYPTRPPLIAFKTKIWHPNVAWKTGEICLDVLASQWSPAWTLSSACTAVIALLDAPEADSPLNVDAATLLRTNDRLAYRSMCRMYTELHAVPQSSTPVVADQDEEIDLGHDATVSAQ